MPETSSDLRTYYANRAEEYDEVYQKPERQQDISWLREWLPACFRGSSVLDVAAGTGFWSRDIASVAKKLVAIDASRETLQIARARLPADKVTFVVGDVDRLPFRPSSFSAAFVGFWFSHIPRSQRKTFLSNLGRLTEPGSTVVLLDNVYVEGSNHPISGMDDEGNTYQSRRLSNGTEYRVLKNFPMREEILAEVAHVAEEAVHIELKYYWAVRYRSVGI